MLIADAPLRDRLIKAGARYRHTELIPVLLIVGLSIPLLWSLLVGGTMVGQDTSTQFYPWFAHLGERLRSGDIPGWSPFGFSGAPFAADPQSGWMYLPAMLLFSAFSLVPAAKAYVTLHLLLAGLGCYALARALKLSPVAALTAALAYEYSGLMFARSPCCPNYTAVEAWLPWVLLGAELAMRSDGWRRRLLGWGVCGLALSQVLAMWLGQGAYYVLLLLGGYIAYRTLLDAPDPTQGLRARALTFVLHGVAVLIFGFGLAAAGLLPRLEYNLLSNLSGGYPGTEQESVGGWRLEQWSLVLRSSAWYAGGAVLALAVLAPFVARRSSKMIDHAVPYLALVSVLALLLSGQGPTPAHWVLGLLPGFSRLHPHEPERVMMMFYLMAALLAGATLTAVGERRKPGRPALLAIAGALVAFLLTFVFGLTTVVTLVAVIVACALLLVCVRRPDWVPAVSALLLLVVLVDLFVAGQDLLFTRQITTGAHGFRKFDLNQYYSPTDSGRFLLARSKGETFRFFGYDPEIPGEPRAYPPQWTEAEASRLLVNNRATVLGLQDVQGYNPIHLDRYDKYLTRLNRRSQGYRSANIYRQGFDSPLLDLLNVRYIITRAVAPAGRDDVRELVRTFPTVHRNQYIRVLRNPKALPRAWIVHSAVREQPARALNLLASGEVDPRQTALLETTPSSLAAPTDAAADRAQVVAYSPDRITVRASTTAPGLLVLSEVYYPAWKAYVDGKPAQLLVADYLFRGVPLPAGEHTVELRYESTTLRLGIIISAVFALGLVAIAAVWVLRRGRDTAPHPSVAPTDVRDHHPAETPQL